MCITHLNKTITVAILCVVQCIYGQGIGDFVSLQPGAQDAEFHIPSTHSFQRFIEHGDALTEGGTVPDNFDFTGYVPIDGSSASGYLSLNSELTPGGASVFDVYLDTAYLKWRTTLSQAIDFSGVAGTARNCSGAITPWGTVISCEEAIDTNDANGDGHYDIGWAVEIDPVNKVVIDKLWELGNLKHENVCIHPNLRTVYQGADSNPGYLFRFVASSAADLSAGDLYVYKGPKDGNGNWLQLNNDTPAERNSVLSQSATAGATVFNGIEDVEIGPDSLIYFAVKGESRVYRFNDPDPVAGDTVIAMETFVGGMDYEIADGEDIQTESCCSGADNLAFDDVGNLWLLQDGGGNYIWVVRNGHTQSAPDIHIFGRTPSGSEPTGITFSPDFKYLFMSVQHPASENGSVIQQDAFGVDVGFDTDIALVIARTENLAPPEGCAPPGTLCNDGDPQTTNDREDGYCNCTGVRASDTLQVHVSNGSDDVEENGNDGSIYFNSSDLELVNDGSRGDQVVGILFRNVQVPQGSFIQDAYIQFTVDEADLVTNTIHITQENADSAIAFANVAYNVSDRIRTAESVTWSVPSWPESSIGDNGYDQRTPTLRKLVQEVVDRSGWQWQNNMTFIIEGSGVKTAEAFEGASGSAPVLYLAFDTACTLAGRILVAHDATGKNTGESWQDAFPNLHDALEWAGQCPGLSEVWVKEGTYKTGCDTCRSQAFVIPDGIAVYGGFAGTETSLSERDIVLHPVVLSGDIGVPLDSSDNAYHVLEIASDVDSALISGIIIQDGMANGTTESQRRGAGVHVEGSVTLQDIKITHCTSLLEGAGLYLESNAYMILQDVLISGNNSSLNTAVFQNAGSTLIFSETLSVIQD